MDYALLQRMMEVQGVAGRIVIDRDEPAGALRPMLRESGQLPLIADNLLEDIAGNHLDRAFDVDLREKAIPAAVAAKTVSLPFSVR